MNNECIYYVHTYVVPAALDLLPGRMDTPAARAMLLAIGLQESAFDDRVQAPNGPAHGFWQFEKGGGVKGVLTHPVTAPILLPVLQTLNYQADVTECYQAIVHNDVLACVFARLLLWTVPGSLPGIREPERGWTQYLAGWRPGKPHPATWSTNFMEGWRTVLEESD